MEYNATETESLEFAEVSVGVACDPFALPSVAEYFAAFNLLGVGLFSLGGLAVTITFGLYIDTIMHILRFAPPKTKTHSCFVVSVYPVVCLVTFCATLVPRAQYIAESVCQGMFMCSMYQLFCLVLAYAGGESMLVKRLSPCDISLKVAPCCCCCVCLPSFKLTKNRLKILRALVLQLPIVQGLTYLGLLVMWAEEQEYSVCLTLTMGGEWSEDTKHHMGPEVMGPEAHGTRCAIRTGVWERVVEEELAPLPRLI